MGGNETNELVAKYIEMRDLKAERKKRYTEENEPLEQAMTLIEGMLLDRFTADGIESVRTEAGTAYKSKRVTANVADWEGLLAFIREHELWHFLEKRVSKDAVQTYREAENAIPPGVKWSEEYTINVRRS